MKHRNKFTKQQIETIQECLPGVGDRNKFTKQQIETIKECLPGVGDKQIANRNDPFVLRKDKDRMFLRNREVKVVFDDEIEELMGNKNKNTTPIRTTKGKKPKNSRNGRKSKVSNESKLTKIASIRRKSIRKRKPTEKRMISP